MSLTININNLSLCHKGSKGTTTATLPDVCKTPAPGGPVPVPYPNIAFARDLMKGTTTIKADGGNMSAKYGSEFFKSTGDEAGTVGGVVSSTFIKEASWITYSFDVKFEGNGACRLTDKMFHNHQNTVNMAGLLQRILVLLGYSRCPGQSPADAEKGIKDALKEQRKQLEEKKKTLKRWNKSDQANFKKWFGSADEKSRKLMSARVDKVLAKNKSFSASNFLPAEGKHDKKELYAYVYGNKENTIFLGRNFCKAAVSGKDGKAGTLSHEMSHYKSISATLSLIHISEPTRPY